MKKKNLYKKLGKKLQKNLLTKSKKHYHLFMQRVIHLQICQFECIMDILNMWFAFINY